MSSIANISDKEKLKNNLLTIYVKKIWRGRNINTCIHNHWINQNKPTVLYTFFLLRLLDPRAAPATILSIVVLAFLCNITRFLELETLTDNATNCGKNTANKILKYKVL